MWRAALGFMLVVPCGLCVCSASHADNDPVMVEGLEWDGVDSVPRVIAATPQQIIVSMHTYSGEKDSLVSWEFASGKLHSLLKRQSMWSPTPKAVKIGGKVFVLAASALLQDLMALWAVDGSPAEIQEVCVLGPSKSISIILPSPDASYAVIGMREAEEDEPGQMTLWRTDGTATGTVCLAKNQGQVISPYSRLMPLDGKRWAIFTHRIPSKHSFEPGAWISDGTPEHTSYTVLPEMIDHFHADQETNVNLGGAIVFMPFTYFESDTKLYRTDGTADGTRQISTIRWQGRKVVATSLCTMGDHAYLLLVDAAHGWDLWRTDGTAGGLELVKTMEPYKNSFVSFPRHSSHPTMAAVGNRLIFVVDDGEHGEEPWVTDGTSAGCRLLRDFNPGPNDCQYHTITQRDGKLNFWITTKDLVDRPWMELWSTDGTDQGTKRQAQMQTDQWRSCEADRTSVIAGGQVFFECHDLEHGWALWRMKLGEK